jgi:hypothetical protein
VGFGGLSTFAGPYVTTTDSGGSYSLPSVPEGDYPQLFAERAAGFDTAIAGGVKIDDAAPLTQDFPVRRDWAALTGGADTVPSDNTYCGRIFAIDHSQAVGWSATNPDPDDNVPDYAGQSVVVQLPQAITVSSFAIDPGATCGDGASATLKNYRLETSPDGSDWTTAKEARNSGGFTAGQAGSMIPIIPTGGTENVRFVRLTMYEPQDECSTCDGRDWIDVSELAVYGAPPNELPSGTLSVGPAVAGSEVTLDASNITDPDSLITGYRWDFDGNGTIDSSTSAPTTKTTYAAAGNVTAAVTVDDFRGGSTTVQQPFSVAAAPVPAPTPVPKAPTVSLKGPRRANAVTITVECQSACSGSASLRITARQAKRFGLKKFTVGARALRLSAGRHVVRVPLKKSVLRKMRKKRARFVRVRLALTLTDTAGLKRRASGRPRIAISRK